MHRVARRVEGGGDAHMQMLPKLARALMKKDFKAALASATTEAEVVAIVEAQVALDPPKAAAAPSTMPGSSATLSRSPFTSATDFGRRFSSSTCKACASSLDER